MMKQIKDVEGKIAKVQAGLDDLTPKLSAARERLEAAVNEGDITGLSKFSSTVGAMEAEQAAFSRSLEKLNTRLEELKTEQAEVDHKALLDKQRQAVRSHVDKVNSKLTAAFVCLSEALSIAAQPPEFHELNRVTSKSIYDEINGTAAIEAAMKMVLPGSLTGDGIRVKYASPSSAEEIRTVMDKAVEKINYI